MKLERYGQRDEGQQYNVWWPEWMQKKGHGTFVFMQNVASSLNGCCRGECVASENFDSLSRSIDGCMLLQRLREEALQRAEFPCRICRAFPTRKPRVSLHGCSEHPIPPPMLSQTERGRGKERHRQGRHPDPVYF